MTTTNPTPPPTAPTAREVEAIKFSIRLIEDILTHGSAPPIIQRDPIPHQELADALRAYLARLDAARDGSREDDTITVTATKRFDCWSRNDLGHDRVAVCFDSDAGRATSLVLSGEALASLYVELRRFLGELGGHGPSRDEAKRAVARLDAARDEQPRCRETTPCEQPAMCVEHECQPAAAPAHDGYMPLFLTTLRQKLADARVQRTEDAANMLLGCFLANADNLIEFAERGLKAPPPAPRIRPASEAEVGKAYWLRWPGTASDSWALARRMDGGWSFFGATVMKSGRIHRVGRNTDLKDASLLPLAEGEIADCAPPGDDAHAPAAEPAPAAPAGDDGATRACPFCGGGEIGCYEDHLGYHYIGCNDCDVWFDGRSRGFGVPREAEEAWNTRVPRPAPVESVEGEVEALERAAAPGTADATGGERSSSSEGAKP